MRVLINREPVGRHLGLEFERNDRDFIGRGDCERIILELLQHLEWLDEVRPLLEQEALPPASADLLQDKLAEVDAISTSQRGPA